MSKEELIKKYQEIVLKTNGGIEDYVVALCHIANAINELEDTTDLQNQLAELKAENERLKGELREQNKLLQLVIPKFEISQVVYSIRNINTIMPLTISSYNYNEKTKRLEYWNSFDVFIGTNEDIFATQAEAEAKLKELRGENDE